MGSIRLGSALALVVTMMFGVAAAAAAAGVDRAPPQTTITSAPPEEIVVRGGQTATTTWAFAADEPASFTCKFTGNQVAPCTSPMTYAGLPKGRYTFTVYAIDPAGNLESTRARGHVKVVKAKGR